MRKVQIYLTIAVCLFFVASTVTAQNCKPDSSGIDSISKQQIDRWFQPLYTTSFGGSLMGTSEVSITLIVGSYGGGNAITLQIQKEEESKQNATFESAYRAEKGNQFFLGVKNGEALSFTATSVSNKTVVGGLLVGKVITTVILAANVPNQKLAALKAALTQNQIDAVRVILAGDLQIDKAVNEKNGKKMMEKFGCFYQSLDKKGIDLSAAPVQPVPPSDASIPGKYVRKDKTSDYFELKPDGTFSLQQDGKGYGGNYNVNAEWISVQVSDSPVVKMRISGNTLDLNGMVWEKQTEVQKSSSPQLSIDQIIKMVAAKLPDDIIITQIQKASSKFDLTTDDLIKLKTAGVSDAVIRAMTK